MSQTYSAEALERGLLATLMNRMSTEQLILVNALCEFVESNGVDEKHEWLDDPPQMTAFDGERKNTPLKGASVTIENEVYDASVLVSRDHLRRNRSGSMMKKINRLANKVAAFPNKLVVDTIIANPTGYDGVSLFNDTHPVRGDESGTQDNLLAGTGTTTAQFQTDFAAALSTLKSFEDETGEPFHGDGPASLFAMVPPLLEKPARETLNAAIISNTSNVAHVNMADLYVTSRLSDTNDWYLFVTDPGVKPLIFQEDQGLETDAIMEGLLWTNKRQAQFGASWCGGCGPGFWQSAVKTVNS